MILLASQSPRRKAILEFIGIPFRVIQTKNVIEERKPNETPSRMVRRLALEKAGAISAKDPEDWILGADTVVVCGKKIFGKPKNRREATRMLMALQGRSHEVWTGVALLNPHAKPIIYAEKTKVTFNLIEPMRMMSYLKSKEPYDKAGGYDIQGSARKWIKKWDGDYFNVLGLPVNWLIPTLNKLIKRN